MVARGTIMFCCRGCIFILTIVVICGHCLFWRRDFVVLHANYECVAEFIVVLSLYVILRCRSLGWLNFPAGTKRYLVNQQSTSPFLTSVDHIGVGGNSMPFALLAPHSGPGDAVHVLLRFAARFLRSCSIEIDPSNGISNRWIGVTAPWRHVVMWTSVVSCRDVEHP